VSAGERRVSDEAFGILEIDMSIGSDSDPPAMERLSALADGELDAAAVARLCTSWRDDADMRSAWHAYQIIGDVLRSDDLASHAAHDASFLAALRARLADEPTVLAPQVPMERPYPVVHAVGAHAGRSARWGWMAPSAVAAGFVLVAGAVMVTRGPMSGTPAPATVVADGKVAVPATALAPQEQVMQRRLAPNGTFIRDARLDRYLAAHQQFAGASPIGAPSAFLRHAAVEAPGR
jgi:sigma-E factor negative regulatory protein RseA